MTRLALLTLLFVGIAACDRCGTGSRGFIIDAPDPDLAALLQTCLDAAPCNSGTSGYCTPPACLSACQRVAELANDTTSKDSLTSCYVSRVADGGTAIQVSISYDTCS